MSVMPPPVRNRRRWRRSPPELVFGFSLEGGRREEAFYRSLDGNAEYEDLLERDRLAEEQHITDLRRQQDMEQQRTDYVDAGARQIALEAVGHARVRDADFYYQLVKWVSHLEAEASVDHAGMKGQCARATRPIAPLASPRRDGGRRCRRLAWTADGAWHRLVS